MVAIVQKLFGQCFAIVRTLFSIYHTLVCNCLRALGRCPQTSLQLFGRLGGMSPNQFAIVLAPGEMPQPSLQLFQGLGGGQALQSVFGVQRGQWRSLRVQQSQSQRVRAQGESPETPGGQEMLPTTTQCRRGCLMHAHCLFALSDGYA